MLRLTLVVIAATGCQEYDLRNRSPAPQGALADIAVHPSSLRFPALAASDSDIQTFTVSNEGEAPLSVAGFELAGAAAFTVLAEGPLLLEPGASVPVDVQFTPMSSEDFGVVHVTSDDPDEPSVAVELMGEGEVPELRITPEDHLFPTICADAVEIVLESVGAEVLTVEGVSFEADPGLSLVDDNLWPLTLAPAEKASLRVRYDPEAALTAFATLEVRSDDPRGVLSAQQQAEGGNGTVTETFEIATDPPVDILFAIDKSCSMQEEAFNLGRAFGSFIDEVAAVTSEWQIGVVTKDHGCFNQGIITVNTPDYEAVFQKATSGPVFFEDDLTEALLALTHNALVETGPAGCNAGFVRPSAVLHIVVISDEPEQSGTPWDTWVGGFQARMTDPDLVVISAVVDENDDCGELGTGYIEAAGATGGLLLDVCSSDWGVYAADLGALSAVSARTFLLSSIPDPESIVVSVNGVPYANGWHYDPVRNAIVVDADLAAGTEVIVQYTAVGC